MIWGLLPEDTIIFLIQGNVSIWCHFSLSYMKDNIPQFYFLASLIPSLLYLPSYFPSVFLSLLCFNYKSKNIFHVNSTRAFLFFLIAKSFIEWLFHCLRYQSLAKYNNTTINNSCICNYMTRKVYHQDEFRGENTISKCTLYFNKYRQIPSTGV